MRMHAERMRSVVPENDLERIADFAMKNRAEKAEICVLGTRGWSFVNVASVYSR